MIVVYLQTVMVLPYVYYYWERTGKVNTETLETTEADMEGEEARNSALAERLGQGASKRKVRAGVIGAFSVITLIYIIV